MGPPKDKRVIKLTSSSIWGKKSFGTFKNTNEKVWCCWGLGHTGLENSWCRPVRLWLLRKNMHFPTGWRPVAGGCCKEVVATKTSLWLLWSLADCRGRLWFSWKLPTCLQTPLTSSLCDADQSLRIFAFKVKICAFLLQPTHFKRRNFYFESEWSAVPVCAALFTVSLLLSETGGWQVL